MNGIVGCKQRDIDLKGKLKVCSFYLKGIVSHFGEIFFSDEMMNIVAKYH